MTKIRSVTDMEPQFRLFPPSASSVAGDVDALYFFLCAVSGFFTLLIFVLIVYFGLRYRRRSEAMPPYVPTNMKLEITWIAIPFVLVLVMFGWGASLFVRLSTPPPDAMQINVIGKQWMWKTQHPGGQREINELHVPVGRAIKLVMTSQDVIHSFYIPAFRIKQDVLPGRYSTQWFEATSTGEYHLFCAEYCGTGHSTMVGRIVVMKEQDYEAWLAGRVPDEPPVVAGQKLFASYGCMACHGQQGPTMAGLYGSTVRLSDGRTVVADENYLRESILNPHAKIVAGFLPIMPTYQGQLSEEQVFQLIAYIKSLQAARRDGSEERQVAP